LLLARYNLEWLLARKMPEQSKQPRGLSLASVADNLRHRTPGDFPLTAENRVPDWYRSLSFRLLSRRAVERAAPRAFRVAAEEACADRVSRVA
jgi:hypothetical protein